MNLPHDPDAELAVLGSVTVYEEQLDDVRAILPDPAAFYGERNRLVYQAVLALAAAGTPVSTVTLRDRLIASNTLEQAGGLAYLMGLYDTDAPPAAYAVSYARIVAKHYARRRTIQAAQRIQQAALNDADLDPDALHALALDLLAGSAPTDTSSTARQLVDGLEQDVLDAEARARGHRARGSVTTGLRDLDAIVTAFEPGQLIVLAARPMMGKSALALHMGLAAAEQGSRVLYASLEMGQRELGRRAACARARVDAMRLKEGNLNPRDKARLYDATRQVRALPFIVDDRGTLTPDQLRARARATQADLVIVDYLQLMHAGHRASDNRQQEVAAVSRALKALARDLSVPVLALAQLSRALEARDNKRPRMSDLRESGQIEQDADVIAFIYREEVYEPQTERQGLAEIIVGKQRSGPLGTAVVQWHAQHVRFNDLAFAGAA